MNCVTPHKGSKCRLIITLSLFECCAIELLNQTIITFFRSYSFVLPLVPINTSQLPPTSGSSDNPNSLYIICSIDGACDPLQARGFTTTCLVVCY